MKYFCVVAHPDDCVIFFNSFIEKFKQECVGILYLTYGLNHPRYLEMKAHWGQYDIPVYTLGFIDSANDLHKGKCSIELAEVKGRMQDFLKDYSFDCVATHNFYGEYGHPHHILLHKCVDSLGFKMIVPEFHSVNSLRILYKKPDVSKLPLHREAISHFHNKFYGDTRFARYSLSRVSLEDIIDLTHKDDDLRLPDRSWIANDYLPSLTGDVLFIGVNWLSLNYHLLTKANFKTLDISDSLEYLGSPMGHFVENFIDHGYAYDHVSIHGLLGHPSYNLFNKINTVDQMEAHLISVYTCLDKLVRPGGTLMVGHHLDLPLFDKNFYLNSILNSEALKGYKVVSLPEGMWSNFITILYKYKG